jgi:hypothetical protein
VKNKASLLAAFAIALFGYQQSQAVTLDVSTEFNPTSPFAYVTLNLEDPGATTKVRYSIDDYTPAGDLWVLTAPNFSLPVAGPYTFGLGPHTAKAVLYEGASEVATLTQEFVLTSVDDNHGSTLVLLGGATLAAMGCVRRRLVVI